MAYNEDLSARIRQSLAGVPGVVEKKMFGGVGYMVQGNMACGVNGDNMIVRVGMERQDEVLSMDGARPFDMTGRPMKGWVMVAKEGLQDEAAFNRLMEWSLQHALSLPPK